MLRVIIESPFKGDTEEQIQRNIGYLHRCLRDSLDRHEAPFASHAIYTQVLDDNKPAERRQGINAGFAWGRVGEIVAVYLDFGVTHGMMEGIERAKENEIYVSYRTIGEQPCDCLYCQQIARWARYRNLLKQKKKEE